ncbi:MAG TPA: molecular chaperone DnaJ [Aggregatilineales bacterium]|jgi:molecular chaperone DnaJ|nr:molecular chaperone DnaJ [Aggregatilineales bacterium]
MAKDYYDVLGVSRSASKDDIKKAFRGLARQYHPDVSQETDAEERFKEINEAYEVLSDDEKRARYDRFGHAGVAGAGMGGGGFGGATGFEEIFEEFMSAFGGARTSSSGRRRGPRAGGNRKVDVNVTFEEAVFGVEREVEFERFEVCDECTGSGAAPGSAPIKCAQCNGTGEVRQVQQTFLGSMVRVATCPTCGGKGTTIPNRCRKCDGSGRLRKRAVLKIKIPAGVREGLEMQVRGEGDFGDVDAPRGNLSVFIHVREHEFFRRQENDILLDVTINVAQAALGDKIVIPTVDGEVELSIPAGTQSGKTFRLRGKGFPRLRSDGTSAGRADQLVTVYVEVPNRLTDRQRELFQELAQSFGTEVQPQAREKDSDKPFFERVRGFFTGDNPSGE